VRRAINLDSLAPTLFSKRSGQECLDPGDGAGYAAVTRWAVSTLLSSPVRRSCEIDGVEGFSQFALASQVALSPQFWLDPGESIKVPLRFQLPPGEYEFLAGYGGAVHEFRPMASNRVSFDVDASGRAHLSPGLALIGPPAPKK